MVGKRGSRKFHKLARRSDGYKMGYRYIEYRGEAPTRFLRHKPKATKRHR